MEKPIKNEDAPMTEWLPDAHPLDMNHAQGETMKQDWRSDLYKIIDFNPSMSKKEKDALIWLLDDKIIPHIIKSELFRFRDEIVGKKESMLVEGIYTTQEYVTVEDIDAVSEAWGLPK